MLDLDPSDPKYELTFGLSPFCTTFASVRSVGAFLLAVLFTLFLFALTSRCGTAWLLFGGRRLCAIVLRLDDWRVAWCS